MSLTVGLGDVPAGGHGDPARVGVLDDGDRHRVTVVVGGPERGVGVGVVVVAHGFAVQLPGVRHPPAPPVSRVDGGGLVGVLPVAQAGQAFVADADVDGRRGPVGPGLPGAGRIILLDLAGEPGGHCGVVGGGAGEGPGGQGAALGEGEAAGGDGPGDLVVSIRIGDDGHCRVILSGRPDHGGPANVDLLDAGVEGGTGSDRIGEGVEVDDDEVDRGRVQLGEPAHVLDLATIGENPGVDAGMEGLDTPLEALGETGDLLHRGDRQVRGRDGGGG